MLGRLVSGYLNHNTTTYSYDVADELTQVVDASGQNTTTINYDSLGRKTSMADPDLGTWRYTYPASPTSANPLWLVATQTDALSQAVSFQYDKLDRMTAKSGTSLSVTYTYDTGTGTNLIGRRASMTDSAGSATYSDDPRGRLTSFTRVIDGTPSNDTYTITTTYDEQDRVLTETFPNQDVLTYDYGDHGMAVNLNLNGWYLVRGAQYNQLLKPTSYPLGNGLTTIDQYWGIDHLGAHQGTSFGLPYNLQTSTFQNMTFGAIDPVGNPTSISYADHTSESLSFTYNDLNQLTGMSGSASESYAFLQGASGSQYNIGNVVTKGSASYTYPTGSGALHPHAPTNVSTIGNYTYDPNGNRKTDPTYSYDVENHLATLTQGATTILQNSYDGDGARVVRTANNQTTHFIGQYYEYNVTTQTATTYCPFNGTPVAVKQGLVVTYLHHDQLGSLVSATNAIGAEVFSARYWPFGSLRTSTGTAPTDRLFAGQIRDLGNDAFYHFPARYLDTTIGKFHTPDTLVPDPGNPQALNRYSYVLNQLLKLQDPTGHAYDSSDSDSSGSVDIGATLTSDLSDTQYASDTADSGTYDNPNAGLNAAASESTESSESQGGDAVVSVQEPLGGAGTGSSATPSTTPAPEPAPTPEGAPPPPQGPSLNPTGVENWVNTGLGLELGSLGEESYTVIRIRQLMIQFPEINFTLMIDDISRERILTAGAERARVAGPALGLAFLGYDEYNIVQQANRGQISNRVAIEEGLATAAIGVAAIGAVALLSPALVPALAIGVGAAALTGAVNQGIKTGNWSPSSLGAGAWGAIDPLQ